MAARRRLSKNAGVRAAIERGWWPYLPVCWIVLNGKDVLEVGAPGATGGRASGEIATLKIVIMRKPPWIFGLLTLTTSSSGTDGCITAAFDLSQERVIGSADELGAGRIGGMLTLPHYQAECG